MVKNPVINAAFAIFLGGLIFFFIVEPNFSHEYSKEPNSQVALNLSNESPSENDTKTPSVDNKNSPTPNGNSPKTQTGSDSPAPKIKINNPNSQPLKNPSTPPQNPNLPQQNNPSVPGFPGGGPGPGGYIPPGPDDNMDHPDIAPPPDMDEGFPDPEMEDSDEDF